MLTPAQIASLTTLFPRQQCFTELPDRLPYESDAGVIACLPDAVVILNSAEEVQRLVRWADYHQVPLVARGAGTGLTGGAVAEHGGVMVSFARLNEIRQVDVDGRLAQVEVGVINQSLNRALAVEGLFYPPDPASYSVSTLGGNIAENAGGPHCLKYGVTGNYVQGLDLILADGSRLWLGGWAADPPEFDFVSLLTGSEGTLGMIAQAVLRLRRPAAGVKTLTASFADVTVAGQAVSAVIAAGLTPATIELMDHNMINIVEDYLGLGLLREAAALLIFDIEGYPHSLDVQLDSVANILKRYTPLDLKIARTAEERERLWLGRRSAAGAVARVSPSEYVLDVCVPRSRLAEALGAINAIATRWGFPVTYLAHAGDGNLHPGLLCDLTREDDQRRVHHASTEILHYCAGIGGSIGGEHGIGIEKREFMQDMYGSGELAAMLQVKQVFDPHNLFNPGKIFPDHLEAASPAVGRGPDGGLRPYLPGSPILPVNAVQAAEALADLQESAQPVYLAGGGSQWRGDPPPGSLLSTRRLNGILKLSAQDFYVTALAGTPLVELHQALGEAGFCLPAASPWPETTLGGLLVASLNSPLRGLYGGLRDQALAVQVALPGGSLLRFGRPLMKDVAGYQMHKLFCGSYGALGLLTEITFKIYSHPLARRSLGVHCPELSQAVKLGFAALRRASICSGAVVVPGSLEDRTLPGCSLLLTLEGHPADVAAELAELRLALGQVSDGEIREPEHYTAVGLWCARQADWPLALRSAASPGTLARANQPPRAGLGCR